MPMEKAAYRDNLEGILKFTNGAHSLNIRQTCNYLGIVDPRTVKRKFPKHFKNGIISAEALARELS